MIKAMKKRVKILQKANITSAAILITFFLNVQLSTFNANAQAPEQFPYQAVIRNNAGEILKGMPVDIRIQLLQDTTMDVVYSETHKDTTNAFGLVKLAVGSGEALEDSFSNIDWKAGNVFIEIGLKRAEENDYTNMGTAQLLSVPYALYAKTAMDVHDNDTSPVNELQRLGLNGTKLSITKTNDTIRLGHFRDGVNDADSIIGNEWIDSITIAGHYLVLHEGGQTLEMNIRDIQNDEDTSILNELIDSIVFDNDTLIIFEGKGKKINKVYLGVLNQKNMSVNDEDADPTNEIQYLKREGNLLFLTDLEGHSTSDTINLGIYDKDNQELSVFRNNDTVYIAIERGDTATFSIADRDFCDTNEIQTLEDVLNRGHDAADYSIENIATPLDDGDAATYNYVDSLRDRLEDIFTEANLYDFLVDPNINEIIYDQETSLLMDSRDNQIYRTMKIGNTWWMLDDLDYEGTNEYGHYYEDTSDPTNRHYGKYYERSELDGICPDGWEIPGIDDYEALHNAYAGEELLVEGFSGLDLVIAGVYIGGSSSVWFDNYVFYWAENDDNEYVYYYLDHLDDYSYDFGTTGSSPEIMRVRCVK
jgi:uncharacterized protein (TIGR02145 family)